MEAYSYTLANTDFYVPLGEAVSARAKFTPSTVPSGWRATTHDVWTVWSADDVVRAEEGWKVHISARIDRAQRVLDVVADACFAERTSFKHLRNELFFLTVHHKHGPRQQAGKFCAAYPADEAAARRLMERLSSALSDEEGPYVLTDRRFGESRTVHYRWGAFSARGRRRPDGGLDWLVRDGFGREVVDVRDPGFLLPPGISDPFAAEADVTHQGAIVLGGSYEVLGVIRHSNGGGTYEGRDLRSGRQVFIKEARAHNGLGWDGSSAQDRLRREHDVLRRLHAISPGICPEPLDYVREWEHEFLVTEFLAGMSLNHWIARRSPVVQANRAEGEFVTYYAACERILEDVEEALRRLHEIGYRFGDVSPGNIHVAEDGRARLVDFETASHRDQPPIRMGTDGYSPPVELIDTHPFAQDDYGLSALALALLMPMHNVLQRRPANLRLLRRDLEKLAPIPAPLWRRASKYCREGQEPLEQRLPGPEDLDARPRESLAWLARELRRGLLAVAEPGGARVFPTVPRGLGTNTTCLAYGTAGVLHALARTGTSIPRNLVARFRTDAVAGGRDMAPGLHVGSAGVAWTLMDLGFVEEALELLGHAHEHPIVQLSTTLGEGLAGVALAHLALLRHTGDGRLLERAAAAGDAILAITDLDTTLGANGAVGLLHGRAGVSLFLYYLAAETGEQRYLEAGARLLHEELDRAISLPDGALSFADDAVRRRAMPYLYAGSAGVAFALTRYARRAPDERFAVALPRIVADIRKTCTAQAGLYCGLAGLALVLDEHAAWAGDPSDHDAALSLATGLMKYAVRDAKGVRFHGDGLLRYSAELWSGGAGILLALDRVLHRTADHFFTLDGPPRSLAQAA